MRKEHIGVAVIGLITVGYVVFRAHIFLTGPVLTVYSPAPQSTQPQIVTVEGHTEGAVFLSINDRQVFPDRDGFFGKDIVLPIGYTILKVYAENRQGRERVIYLPLYIQNNL